MNPNNMTEQTVETTPFEQTPGHELMRPAKVVKGSDQLRLITALQDLGLDLHGNNNDTADIDLRKAPDFIDYVSKNFAKDPNGFDEFTCGQGGFQRAIELAFAYASHLVKDAA